MMRRGIAVSVLCSFLIVPSIGFAETWEEKIEATVKNV